MFRCCRKEVQALELKVEENVYSSLPGAVRKCTRFFRAAASQTFTDYGKLQFGVGDVLEVEITVKNALGQCRATNLGNGRHGFVDASIVEQESLLDYKPWFFGDISRIESEERLSRRAPGSYIVRICSRENPYALSVKSATAVKHYRIFREEAGFCISQGIYSATLEELIFLYESDVDGHLCIERLLEPCPK